MAAPTDIIRFTRLLHADGEFILFDSGAVTKWADPRRNAHRGWLLLQYR
ncbi:hypothetical protein [Paraburkholderia dinghuensis]|nr:hypothetical protein [Paraburkholderia dinghuensis]